MEYTLDSVDKKIIGMLQKNARIPVKEIAKEVYLSSPAVSARISRLEKDMEKLGHLYARGYKDAKDQMEQLKAYLGMK